MEWLSTTEAAERLNVSERHVRRLAVDGRLVGRRVGSHWLISADSVRTRSRSEPVPGRPLSPPMAWAVLRAADAVLDGFTDEGGPSEAASLDAVFEGVPDRRDRHRLRSLLAEPPPVEQWDQWLSRRADEQRVWVHPGVLEHLRADPRLRVGGARAAVAAGLEGPAGDLDRFYVDADDYEGVVADHRAHPADDGQVVLMVVSPAVPEAALGPLGEPVAAAVGLVDCLVSSDARERHLAREYLERAARRLTQAMGAGR